MAAAAMVLSCTRQGGELVPTDYDVWARSTERELDYPVPGHLDNYRIIYVNDKGRQYTVQAEEGHSVTTFPPGAMFVKEVYTGMGRPAEGTAPAMLTVMLKAPDDPRSQRGWLFVVKDPSTGTETVMKPAFCADCHAAASDPHGYGAGNPNGEPRDGVYIVPPPLR
jgi:hypothetical protein